MARLKTVWELTSQTIIKWREDKSLQLGAALSFYTVLSLPALLVIGIGIAGRFFSEGRARDEVLRQAQEWIGAEGSRTIDTVLEASSAAGRGYGTTLLGLLLLMFAATSVFSQIQSAMNTIWEAEPPASIRKSLLNGVKNQALAIAMVFGFGLILLALLVASTLLPLLGGYINEYAPGLDYLVHAINIAVSVLVVTVLLSLAYRFLPDTDVSWRDVWPGALLAALLFTLGKLFIGLYLSHSNIVSAYGASSSLVFLLLWIYYSSQTIFLGAEFGAVCARRRRGTAP